MAAAAAVSRAFTAASQAASGPAWSAGAGRGLGSVAGAGECVGAMLWSERWVAGSGWRGRGQTQWENGEWGRWGFMLGRGEGRGVVSTYLPEPEIRHRQYNWMIYIFFSEVLSSPIEPNYMY